jgi:histidinol-phosphate/aromatic aminotransferase/cobyric acid decarboxylase-like protein
MVPVREGCALRYARELRAKGVAIRPFPAMHGAPEGVRVTVAPWNYMERFLNAFDEVLESDAACEADVVVQVDPRSQTARA